jgi:hypothetical protein
MPASDIGPKPWHLYLDMISRCKGISNPPAALRAILDDHDESGLVTVAESVKDEIDGWDPP